MKVFAQIQWRNFCHDLCIALHTAMTKKENQICSSHLSCLCWRNLGARATWTPSNELKIAHTWHYGKPAAIRPSGDSSNPSVTKLTFACLQVCRLNSTLEYSVDHVMRWVELRKSFSGQQEGICAPPVFILCGWSFDFWCRTLNYSTNWFQRKNLECLHAGRPVSNGIVIKQLPHHENGSFFVILASKRTRVSFLPRSKMNSVSSCSWPKSFH